MDEDAAERSRRAHLESTPSDEGLARLADALAPGRGPSTDVVRPEAAPGLTGAISVRSMATGTDG